VAAGWRELIAGAEDALGAPVGRRRRLAALRLVGQDSTLDVEWPEDGGSDFSDDDDEALRRGLAEAFGHDYRGLFGYPPPAEKPIELVSLRVVVEAVAPEVAAETFDGETVAGPLLRQDRYSTCVVADGWTLRRGSRGTLRIERVGREKEEANGVAGGIAGAGGTDADAPSAAVRSGLFRSRFEGILESMGEALRRTAISTNVKERLDFSCALLDDAGRLVASAPHVPVHLGALGVCVREVAKRLPLAPGEVAITNAPGVGGSHLPDVTVIAPVYDESSSLIGYVANRAHHAEIGGMAPGSMPATATCLAEEGVVIEPMRLVEDGAPRWDRLEARLRDAPYPSRRVSDNLADAEAQLAACHFARSAIEALAADHGADAVRAELRGILDRSAALMRERLTGFGGVRRAAGSLDDGTPLVVALTLERGRLTVDFAGSGAQHPGNLNATPAIVRSVLLYALRVWLDDDVPLNEGLLESVDPRLPPGLLNPDFSPPDDRAPAVVGGNVEVSQRLADLLLEALGICAHGPGTMNNVIFGNETFGYYETLAGGGGAGPEFDGASGRHVHMTNTALTDPEVLEHAYPVRVLCHALRRGSGGSGRRRGGDGIVREIEFREPVTVSLLTQSRTVAPRGLAGGGDGLPGRQFRITAAGEKRPLDGVTTTEFAAGERLRIETPGGGGWGEDSDEEDSE
jgi:5-oxoprolinase (ATP-hydrolysing)